MAVTARKYNPGFLTDDELVGSFCVRTAEFEMLVEVLRECTGPSNPHQIVIGPRGSGKTSLLLRIAAEVSRDAGLAAGFFPVVFAEESYEVSTAGEFWLECLSHLAAQAPRREDAPDLQRTFADLRTIRDDRELADRCLGALLDFSDREGKRLVLLVENLNMLFRDMADADAGWRLRKVLQTEPRIVLLASATSRFDEIDDPKHALYDLFSVRTLRPLDTGECATLWEVVAGQRPQQGTIRSIEILTGGSPRLVAIVARFGAELSFRKLMASLLDLIDDHTEYFKSHLEVLPAQERRVYLALAALWKPATTREIADQSRMETSKCSAQLTRLIGRGVVRSAGGSARRKQYYLTERLYNIYYLMRRSRRSDHLVEALIHFMESYYSPSELMDIGVRIIREVESFTAEMQSLAGTALVQLIALPALVSHRGELLAMIPERFADVRATAERGLNASASAGVIGPGSAPALSDAAETTSGSLEPDGQGTDRPHESPAEEADRIARDLLDTAIALNDQGRAEEALDTCDEVMGRFGQGEADAARKWAAKSLVTRGGILAGMNRKGDALSAWDDVVLRFGQSGTPVLLESVAKAIYNRGIVLNEMNRTQDALDAWEEVVGRFGQSENPVVLGVVARAMYNKGEVSFFAMNRAQDALDTWEDLVDRFGQSEIRDVILPVATALVAKRSALVAMNRFQDALHACEEMVGRFGESEDPAVLRSVAMTFADRGFMLLAMNRLQEALDACEEMVGRFGESEDPAVLQSVTMALAIKGFSLAVVNRFQDALHACAACEEMMGRFRESEDPAILRWVAMALAIKGVTLAAMNRFQDALHACDACEEMAGRFGESEDPGARQSIAMVLSIRGLVLAVMNRPKEALVACNEAIRRLGEDGVPSVLQPAAVAFAFKGLALAAMNRLQEALDACDEALRRLGEDDVPDIFQPAVMAFAVKGEVLGKLNRPRDALVAYDEMMRRIGEDEFPAFGMWIEEALLGKAEIELKCEQYDVAAATAGRMLEQRRTESPENRSRGHLIRAMATVAGEDVSGPVDEQRVGRCERDVEAALAILPEVVPLPSESLLALTFCSFALGPQRMCELINASPSSNLLLPLATALERELGLYPRVAREVEEVAEDIRRNLVMLRETAPMAFGRWGLASPVAMQSERMDD